MYQAWLKIAVSRRYGYATQAIADLAVQPVVEKGIFITTSTVLPPVEGLVLNPELADS